MGHRWLGVEWTLVVLTRHQQCLGFEAVLVVVIGCGVVVISLMVMALTMYLDKKVDVVLVLLAPEALG